MVMTISTVVEQELLLFHSVDALWCTDLLAFGQNVRLVAQLVHAAHFWLAHEVFHFVCVHIVWFHTSLFSSTVRSCPYEVLKHCFVPLHFVSRAHLTLLQD